MSRTDIDFKIGADLKQFRSGMQNIDHSLKRLSGGFNALGASIGAAFVVDAVSQFVSESVDLAMQAEGVKTAFNRLNDPNLLKNLRTATAGTLSDLELMKAAVNAENFRIPMDVLAKGLEFAQRRAQETGQSVDYLVNSFVTGLGRKSVMILDNLGISAAELKEQMEGGADMTTAVGQIIDQEFAKAGPRIETATMKLEQQRAEIENLKTDIGTKLLPAYTAVLSVVSEIVGAFSEPLPDTFAVDEKTEQQLRNQLALINKRIESNEKDLKNYPKNKTYIKNVTRLEEIRTATVDALNAKLEEKKQLEMIESGEQARLDAEAEKARKAKELAEAIEAYNNKLQGLLPNLKQVNKEIDNMFKPENADFAKLGIQLGLDDVSMELEELEDVVEHTADTFDDSFVRKIETLKRFADEVMLIGNVLKTAFDAAFVPLDQLNEGETRIMRFREVLVDQLRQMAAQLIATAAAAAVLAAILTIAFGSSNVAGKAMFGKSGMGFSDLFGGLFGGMGGGFGFSGANLGGGQGGFGNIVGVVQGADLLLINERASRNRSRQRGY